jgi:4-phosphopantoate--beta-alanine ligase
LVDGFRRGIVAAEGLIAHGRGEAFDYLLGEKTSKTAQTAIKAAAALLLVSKRPVISVNGNLAALCPGDVVRLAETTSARIEVNLFYRTDERERAVVNELEKHGAKHVLGVGPNASARIPELQSERRRVDPDGIFAADTVFVPLDKLGKKVITVDLNPISRTAVSSHITIVDNIVRVMPAIVESAVSLKGGKGLKKIVDEFDNASNLSESLEIIRGGS